MENGSNTDANAADGNKVGGNGNASQFDYDPIQRGLSLTVDSSPRGHRNMSVLKAKLREAESKYMLDLNQFKKESETRQVQLLEEIQSLKSHQAELETQLAQGITDKQELIDGKEELKRSLAASLDKLEKLQATCHEHEAASIRAASENLSVWQKKCAELEGRLTESRSAHETSRLHLENVVNDHEQQISTIRNEHSQSLSALDTKLKLREKQNQQLETRFQEADAAYKLSVAELELMALGKYDAIAKLEAEADERKKEFEKQQNDYIEQLKQANDRISEASAVIECSVQKSVQSEKQYEDALEQLRTEHKNATAEWETNEQTLNQKIMDMTLQIEQLEKLSAKKSENLTNNQKKYDDSIAVLKQTLSVIDDQNKDLASEVESIRNDYEANSILREELETKLLTVQQQLHDVQSKKRELTETKNFLENELGSVRQVMAQEVEQKATEIKNLENDLANARKAMTHEVELRDSKIAQLLLQLENLTMCNLNTVQKKDKEVEDLFKANGELREEGDRLQEELMEANAQIAALNITLEEKEENIKNGNQHLAKLNLEVNGLIKMVVNLKEENIELKSGIDEAIQKAEYYKQRNETVSKELTDFQRDRAEKETELKADIEEKRRAIEYLQTVSANTRSTTMEKKKRRFFGNTSPKADKALKKDETKDKEDD